MLLSNQPLTAQLDLAETKIEKVSNLESVQEAKADFETELESSARIIVELEKEPVVSTITKAGGDYETTDSKTIDRLRQSVRSDQEVALKDIKQSDITIDEQAGRINYDTGFKGFAITVKKKDIQKLEEKPYVKRIYYS